MTTDFSAFLARMVITQTKSIQNYHIEGQTVWVKKASRRHSTWIYLPLRWVSALLGLNVLAPIPNCGGTTAIHCEIQRLKQLQQNGIRVPQILAQQNDAFLMHDAVQQALKSQQLDAALKNATSSAIRLKLYQKAILAIEHIHHKNSYLSEAFARNILIDELDHFTFVDFETDPATVLDLDECQSRDWLCFIFSTAHYFTEDELEQVLTFLINALEQNLPCFKNMSRVAIKASWITKLKPEKLGKDGIRLKKCIELLRKLDEQFQEKKFSQVYRN